MTSPSRTAAKRRASRYQPTLESLEGRELPSITVIESEPNDSRTFADSFAFPSNDGMARLRGRVVNSGDNDFFKFSVWANTDLGVVVRTTNGVLPILEVQDQNGTLIFSTDPSNG